MKPRTKSDPLQFISRIESERCWKLQLTASSSKDGQAVQLYFSDSIYGGRAPALTAAQRERDRLKDRQRKLHHRKSTVITACRNLPAGVTYTIDRRLYNDGRKRYDIVWMAYWMAPNPTAEKMEQEKKRFSSRAHGYRTAFTKAKQLRAEKSGFDLSEYDCPNLIDVLSDQDDAPMILEQLIRASL